ncbi:DUF2790 domain-containing protein [Pseudomonas sp. BP8]|uniref:DUF2790 domain-containing protein n=1 Tax=Pseudomonas sp. BP8 TaxID=2817864 RepID=UPI001AE39EF6|nr:DUF2790 domain-containing protein [Pseudomonas sp. BP8]MBP2261592.1 hypothetical protein [Pseudomonas sp. BP8]HDS1733501.1 DUF2790 domain-containing protein [Pseudomonas putida]
MNKLKHAVLFGLVCLASALSVAVQADPAPYEYGESLDVAKVIKLNEPNPPTCQVVEATMTYEDSQGAVKTVSYRRLAGVCTNR